MSLGLILVIILVIFLLGGFSGRFGGYGYGFGHGGVGIIGIILIIVSYCFSWAGFDLTVFRSQKGPARSERNSSFSHIRGSGFGSC
jgi:Na+/melibiose symporter-like transporter